MNTPLLHRKVTYGSQGELACAFKISLRADRKLIKLLHRRRVERERKMVGELDGVREEIWKA